MTNVFERAGALKQDLVDFVYDAEGDLATALEAYAAEQLRSPVKDIDPQELAIETFLTEGQVNGQTPIDLFIQQESTLTETDRQLLRYWSRSFIGLFAVTEVLPNGFRLINWLTAKPYTVCFTNDDQRRDMARLDQRDIILTRIAPVTETEWMISGPYVLKGRLGKPKLAVAIGQFKDDHWHAVYGDAPELLEEAWRSVERYHQEFQDFFGQNEVTLSGYELSKKIADLQEIIAQRHLEAVGLDPSKSLADMVEEVEMGSEEIDAIAETLGINPETLTKMIHHPNAAKMAAPKVELPAELKRAERVTVLAHPRWGLMFLEPYPRLQDLLAANPDADTEEGQRLEKLVRKYLEDSSFNAFVWHRLAQSYPQALEQVLQRVFERPDFDLTQDFDALLTSFNKPLDPPLPEIASVPLHLNDLFQEALAEVMKSKKRKKKATAKGFQ